MEDPGKNNSNDDELMRTLARNFLSDMHDQLDKINTSLSERRNDELIIFGHTLKGTGAMFGYEELSGVGARFEEEAKKEHWENLATLRDEIKTIMDYYLAR